MLEGILYVVKVDRKGKGKGIVIFLLVKGRVVANFLFGRAGKVLFFLNVNFLSAYFCNIVNSRDGTDPIQYQYRAPI